MRSHRTEELQNSGAQASPTLSLNKHLLNVKFGKTEILINKCLSIISEQDSVCGSGAKEGEGEKKSEAICCSQKGL